MNAILSNQCSTGRLQRCVLPPAVSTTLALSKPASEQSGYDFKDLTKIFRYVLWLFAIMANLEIYATAATVRIVAEGPALANAKITEIERRGPSYLGQHVAGFVGDSFELDKGVHYFSLGAPKNYIFDFFVTVGDKDISVGGVSVYPENCKPELKAVWAGPTVTENKAGAVTLGLASPQFGPPTGHETCASPVLVPCERRRVALDVQTSPPGAEIWINGKKQSMRTNHLVETELEVCDNNVDVLFRLPRKTNCSRKVPLSGASTERITCAFARGRLK